MEERDCPRLFLIQIWINLLNCSRNFQWRAIVQICEINPITPKTTIWGWTTISMKLESLRLSCTNQVLIFPRGWLPTWFTCTWSSLAEDLAIQCGTKKFMKSHLLWAVLWPLGFAYFSFQKFSRISIRNALLLAISNNLMYTTSSTTKFRSFCKIVNQTTELVRGAQIS